MEKVVWSTPFTQSFQTELVRCFLHDKDRSRNILKDFNTQSLTIEPLQWAVAKMKKVHITCLRDLVDELRLDLHKGLVKPDFKDDYVRLLRPLKEKPTRIKHTLSIAYEYQRVCDYKDFVIRQAERVNKGDLNWEEITAEMVAQARMAQSFDDSIGTMFFTDTKERLQRRKAVAHNGTPTRTPLDEYMKHGGLPPGMMGLVVAPPGRGKSSTLVHIGGSALIEGKNVVYITMELNEDMIGEKFDARFTNISLSDLSEQEEKLTFKLDMMRRKYSAGDLVIKWFPAGTLTVSKLRAYLQRLADSGFTPEVVLVDYPDLMCKEGANYNDKNYEIMGEIYTQLSGLAQSERFALWVASQAKRSALEKVEIDMDDLADSFMKAHIVDFAFAICQTKKELVLKVARLFVMKSRVGKMGFAVTCSFDTSTSRIRAAQ